MRRYMHFLRDLLGDEPGSFAVSAEVGLWLEGTASALSRTRSAAGNGHVDDDVRFGSLVELGLVSSDRQTLDAHPLVREYFGQRLQEKSPAAWREAHRRLYEYYKGVPEKKYPDTLEEMQPLFVWKGKEYVSAWSELSGSPRPQGPTQEKSLWLFLWVEPGIEDNACAVEIWDRKEKGEYSVVYYKMDEADHRIIIKGSDKTIDEIVPKGTYCKYYTVSLET